MFLCLVLKLYSIVVSTGLTALADLLSFLVIAVGLLVLASSLVIIKKAVIYFTMFNESAVFYLEPNHLVYLLISS